MRRVLEALRIFFISLEFLLTAVAVMTQLTLAKQVELWVAGFSMTDDILKWCVGIPWALLVWSLVSGRKLLFPEKDKKSILQTWPDYWALKLCFHVALAWNLIFVVISIYAWGGDWKQPASSYVIALALSVAGASVCTFSIYNAQTRVEEEVSQYVTKS